MENSVDITIVTFNRLACTIKCLSSIVNNTRHPFRLTIVDNGSKDETRNYLRSLKIDPDYSKYINNIIFLEENFGVSCAYNLGWSLSSSPYYMKIDNDVVFLRSDWLNILVEQADKYPDICMIGFGKNSSGIRHPKDRRLSLAGHVGGCVLIRRDVHEKIGYWNEDYGLYGEEDADYGLRGRLAGYINVLFSDENGAFIKYVDQYDTDRGAYKKWKNAQREKNISMMFMLNDVLFKCGFRDLHVGRKFLHDQVDGVIQLKIDEEYLKVMDGYKKNFLPLLNDIVKSEEFHKINNELGFNFYY